MPHTSYRLLRPSYLLAAALSAAFLALVMATAWRGFGAAFDSDDFPEDLAVKLELLPRIFPLHMVTGALALLLVPLAFGLRKWPRWHRWAGRVAAADVVVAGVTSLPVALSAPVTRVSALGFAAQGCVWLGLLARGVWMIRRGRAAQHRQSMLMMAAVTSGAIFFRVYLAFWAMLAHGAGFALFYACDAWAGWGLPLLATWFVLSRRDATILEKV